MLLKLKGMPCSHSGKCTPINCLLLWQGIELKEAAANVLLGQQHLESGGRFVKAKLPAASSEGTAVHASSATTRSAGSEDFAFAQDAKRQHGAGEGAAVANGASSKSPQKAAVTDPSPFGSPAVF